MSFRRIAPGSLVLAALLVLPGTPAVAAPTFNLFGDATLISPGHNSTTAAQLRSNVSGSGMAFGGVNFATPAGMTLSQVTNLSTDYMFTAASCGGGSPRFQINIDGKNIQIYLGPPPNYTACAQNIWTGSGNLVTLASLVDTSQLPDGMFYDPWSSALAKYGTHAVTGIQLVTDSSWFFGATQTVVVSDDDVDAPVITLGGSTGAELLNRRAKGIERNHVEVGPLVHGAAQP